MILTFYSSNASDASFHMLIYFFKDKFYYTIKTVKRRFFEFGIRLSTFGNMRNENIQQYENNFISDEKKHWPENGKYWVSADIDAGSH